MFRTKIQILSWKFNSLKGLASSDFFVQPSCNVTLIFCANEHNWIEVLENLEIQVLENLEFDFPMIHSRSKSLSWKRRYMLHFYWFIVLSQRAYDGKFWPARASADELLIWITSRQSTIDLV